MKLGGWWRLWIVLAVLHCGVVVVNFTFDWPRAERITHGPWLTYRMSAQSQELLRSPSPTMADLEASLVQADKVGDTEKAKTLARQIIVGREAPWTLHPVVVDGPNGHSFELPASTTESQASAFLQDYSRVLESEATERQSRKIKVLAVVLLVPPGLLLVLGLAIGWVRRGFQRD